MVVVFLLIAASTGLIQLIVELRRGEPVTALQIFHQKPTSANLRAYENSLEESSVVARLLRPWFQFAQFAWMRDGGEKALIGGDGWLFYKPGFDEMVRRHTGTPRLLDDAIAAILAWRDDLAARGIQLLVVPVPNKESIYPDKVTSRMPPGQPLICPATLEVLSRLKAADVDYVDLFEVFTQARTNGHLEPLYLVRDSHWSPDGLELAARAVAEHLISRGWIVPGTNAYVTASTPIVRQGDIVRMLQSARIKQFAAPEQISCSQVSLEHRGKLYEDTASSPVLVLGDSFLRIFERDEPGSAGFIAHLAKNIGQPLTSLVSDGGASTLVRQELYRRPTLLSGKRVLIWEFVERDIFLGQEGWQMVPLPPEVEARTSPRAN